MRLSPHFTLAELTRSETAARLGLRNIPDADGIARLSRVCAEILEPVRAHYQRLVHVNSGYRSRELNARIPGSSNTSQHTLCEAADFEVPGVSTYAVADWVRGSGIAFGQLILEAYVPGETNSGWVHCSLPTPRRRGQVMTMQRRRIDGRLRTIYLQGLVS